MKNVLLLFLLIGVFCGDYRRPSPTQKKCIEKKIGKEPTKKLLESLRKYHRTNGKATILDYILEKRGDLKDVAEECLLGTRRRRRRLDKTVSEKINDSFNNKVVKYYMNALLRDPKAKTSILENIDKAQKDSIKACKRYLKSDEICKMVVDAILQRIEKN